MGYAHSAVPGEHGYGFHLHTVAVLWPQNLHILFPRISGEKNNLNNGVVPDPLCEGAGPRD